MSRWAAILGGGSGTRFWPLSTPKTPKQFLALGGSEPLLRQTVVRLEGLIPVERIFILTGISLVEATRALVPELPAANVLAEPRAASTGPPLAWATVAALARDPEAVVLALHADWFVGDDALFRKTAATALDVAVSHDVLVTVGIVPTRPDIGYGYIEPGDALDARAFRVDRFTEKPDESHAQELIDRGALWNSGMFAWTGTRFVRETMEHAPEISPHLETVRAGEVDRYFERVTPIAVDVSHFERSARVAVVPGRFPWDDVGTWTALSRVRARDEQGNVMVGQTYQRDATGCVVWSEGGSVVVDGVSDLVVVRTGDRTLVTTRDRAMRLKELLDDLPPDIRG